MADSILTKKLLDIYKSLLKVNDDTNGIDGTDENVVDGNGSASTLYLSTTQTSVKPSSNNTNSFAVEQNDGTNCIKVDTTNNRVIVGPNNVYVGAGEFVFSASNLLPVAGYHMMIPCGGTYLGGAADEIDLGNGTDPATSLDISGLTEDTDVIHYYWYHQHTINITGADFFVGSESGTPTCNFNLFNYDLNTAGGANSGDLSNGTRIAWTGANATSSTKIRHMSSAVTGDNCDAVTVTVATVESQGTELLHVKGSIKYHIV